MRQPRRLHGFKYHFLRSSYVTWFTDWLLGFGGKSAHSILIFTTLYMSAELYPGIQFPNGLNIAVFLTQMFALDMGGMGLASLAHQAQEDGNVEGAKKAKHLSNWLIGIMIAGLVTVCLEQATSHLPHAENIQPALDAAKIVIELALVVARAICAVLYGTVIHSLKTEIGHTQTEAQQDRLMELVDQFSRQFQEAQNRQTVKVFERLEAIEKHFQHLLTERLQQAEMGFQNRLTESLEQTERTFQQYTIESLSPVIESLQSHAEILSILPELTAQLGQIEVSTQLQLRTVTEEFKQVRVTVEKQVEALPRLAQRVVSAEASTKAVKAMKAPLSLPAKRSEAVSHDDFNKRQFVFDCLSENPEMTITEMQKRATERGQTLSVGSISGYRKDFQSSFQKRLSVTAIESVTERDVEGEEAITGSVIESVLEVN